MWKRRTILEYLICCALVSAGVWLLPSGYRLEQSFHIKGAIPSSSELNSAVQRDLESSDSSNRLDCTLVGEREVRCSIFTRTRLEKQTWASWLTSTLPENLGLVKRAVIEKRLNVTEAQIEKVQQDQRTLLGSLGQSSLLGESEDQVIHEAQLIVEELKTQLENRQNQLSLLVQGIKEKKSRSENVSLFEQKQREVQKRIEDLHSEIKEAERFLAEVTMPQKEQERVRMRLAEVEKEIENLQFALATWSSALLTHPSKAYIPDPDTFQLSVLKPHFKITPQRPASSLLWTPWLALLIFGWIRPTTLPTNLPSTVQTPEEVTKATGWPCLGRV